MPTDRLNWFALSVASVVCLVADTVLFALIFLVAENFNTALLVLFVGGGPVTFFAIGPLYSWVKARGNLARQLADESARQRARQ